MQLFGKKKETPAEMRPGQALKQPLHENIFEAFQGTELWPRGPFRGSIGEGTRCGWVVFHIRTTDTRADCDAVGRIASSLKLKAGPPQTERLVYSRAEPERGFLTIEFQFMNARSGNCPSRNCYFISVTSATNDVTEAKKLALEIARSLYQAKEKPHFRDKISAAFEKALAAVDS